MYRIVSFLGYIWYAKIWNRDRFLAITSESLDSDTYAPGALVTMMGEVTGKKAQPLGGVENGYPVIVIREIHAIEIEELHPEYDLGI